MCRMVVQPTYFVVHNSFSFKICFILSLILVCCEKSVIGTPTLSPMMVAPVCHIGDQLNLTCTATTESAEVIFIEWSVRLVNKHGILEEITASSNSDDASQAVTPIMVNSTTFTFMRSSARGVLPLISTLSIDSVSIGLNGTVVYCKEVGNAVSTTIQINHTPYTPMLRVTSETFGAKHVTVTVEWAQQVGAMYTVGVLPLVPIMATPVESRSRQLTVSYNTEYNFSIEATVTAPCRVSATAFIVLHYANCGHPKLSTVSNDSVPRVVGYDDDLPIEGSTITFSCPPGLVLTGSNTTTCMGNGQWEPDPTGLMCNHSLTTVTCEHPLLNKSVGSSRSIYILDYSEPAVVGTAVSFNYSESGHVLVGPNTVTCTNDGQWVPDPSLLLMNCTVSCGAPDTHKNVNYSNYNSTLEGSTATFRCTNTLTTTDPFTSMCLRNASWFPDPVNKCTAVLRSDVEESDKTVIIAGASVGVLAVIIVLILLAVVGTTVCIKKDLLRSHKKKFALNIELNEEDNYNHIVHHQQNEEYNTYYSVYDPQNESTTGNIVYADVGPLSNDRPRHSESASEDNLEHRVEYAQLNHKAQNSNPLSSVDNPTTEDISLNLDSLLIQLQGKVTPKWYQFGVALGIEKEILDRYLNYPPEQGIVEILDYWLRSDMKQNWREIARALRRINYHQLAKEIENIDKTGKLPVEVNMDNIPDGVVHRSEFDSADDECPPPIPPKMFEDDLEDLRHKCSAAPILPPKPPKP